MKTIARKFLLGVAVGALTAAMIAGCGGGGGGSGSEGGEVVASSGGDEADGNSSNADLAGLVLSSGTLIPAFDPAVTTYTATVGFLLTSVTVTPTAADSGASVRVNETATASGGTSTAVALNEGINAITVAVTAANGNTKNYAVILTRPGASSCAEQAYLKAFYPRTDDRFGRSVAISGDTLAVGARWENDSATDSGAVYLFTRSGTGWSPQAYLKASNAEAGDLFGVSVAVSGHTVVVGAHLEDSTGIGGDEANNGALDSGAVYVFTRSGTNWSQQAYLKASNAQAGDLFGVSVSVLGDTLAVGAPAHDSEGTNSGAVYVFTRSGTTWSEQATLRASNAGVEGRFGRSVSLSGETLAVGARRDGDNATESGAVYIFTRSGTDWSQQAYLKASIPGGSDQFGASVCLSGDSLAVGASADDSEGTNSGAVYVFTRSGTIWSEQATLKASNAGAGDRFGRSISLSGDTLAVGAPGEDDRALNSGAVYVFTRSGTDWSQQAYLKASNAGEGDRFGPSVSLSGDTLAVGAPGVDNEDGIDSDNGNGQNIGAVYVFR